MSTDLTEIDRRLLDQLQRGIPLVEEPFAEIARRMELDEGQVLSRVRELSGTPKSPIRQIGAIFDSRALGYQSCLVASKVEPGRLADAAAIIGGHPGVSHNYRREHAYNLWFTLAVPPDSKLGLQGTIDRLQEQSGALQMRLLPSLKLYKIGVRFDLSGEGDASPTAPPAEAGGLAKAQLTELDKRMIRALQKHLEPVGRPFDELACEAGVTVRCLLAAAHEYLESGLMRRFSAVLRHREVGVCANAMGVWVVPPEQQDAFGETAASFSAVSHCYLRPSFPDWPYSLFTMVHGKTRDDCEATLRSISAATGIADYTSLYSTVEYKKVRVRYFVGDIEAWEAGGEAAAPAVVASATR